MRWLPPDPRCFFFAVPSASIPPLLPSRVSLLTTDYSTKEASLKYREVTKGTLAVVQNKEKKSLLEKERPNAVLQRRHHRRQHPLSFLPPGRSPPRLPPPPKVREKSPRASLDGKEEYFSFSLFLLLFTSDTSPKLTCGRLTDDNQQKAKGKPRSFFM